MQRTRPSGDILIRLTFEVHISLINLFCEEKIEVFEGEKPAQTIKLLIKINHFIVTL
jgi:hypothetical protein